MKTPPSGLTVGVSQTGQLPAASAARPRSLRSTTCGAGETTCGITSPARITITSSPTRRSLRARSSSLCSVASLTVTPPTWTGSSTANGCRSPNLPGFHWMSLQRRDGRRRRELPGDRPARVASDDAQAALQLVVVDLHDDAVDLEVQRAAALLPGQAALDDLVLAVEQHDVVVDREAALAQPLQRLPLAAERQAVAAAGAVGPERQRPRGRERAGRAGGSCRPPSCEGS